MEREAFSALRKQAKVLKQSNWTSAWWVLRASIVTAIWIYLLSHGSMWALAAGSPLALVVIFNWVSILHECGHGHFFTGRWRWVNTAAGLVGSWFCLLPYEQWRSTHLIHHRWTGYIDKDPTTSGSNDTIFRERQKAIIDFAWKYSIPLFIPSFYVRTFWNPFLSLEFAKTTQQKIFQIFCLVFMFAPYIVLGSLYGGSFFLALLPGHLFAIWFSDPFLLSQHVYLPRMISTEVEGEVKPISVREQDRFTREVTFPAWIANMVFMNFNYHVGHHFFPTLPAYHLAKLDYHAPIRMPFSTWWRKAKRIPGHVLLAESGDL